MMAVPGRRPAALLAGAAIVAAALSCAHQDNGDGVRFDGDDPRRADKAVYSYEPDEDATPSSEAPDAPDERPADQAPKPLAWTYAFPLVRVSNDLSAVEFDGVVSELIHPDQPDRRFYLEQFVCLQGTKDHESLVVTKAKPSNIHAALLLLGLEPGTPVRWTYPDGEPTPLAPEGPEVLVSFIVDGREIDPRDWTTESATGEKFPEGGWVFAGSTEKQNAGRVFYEADAAGTIVGLASFGSETVAWEDPVSHEEADGQLRWLARKDALPAPGTKVTVRLTDVARD